MSETLNRDTELVTGKRDGSFGNMRREIEMKTKRRDDSFE
jgi:hypothetical protein